MVLLKLTVVQSCDRHNKGQVVRDLSCAYLSNTHTRCSLAFFLIATGSTAICLFFFFLHDVTLKHKKIVRLALTFIAFALLLLQH